MTSKSPFLLSFIAGVLSVVIIGALAFGLIFAWRRYCGRHKRGPSSKNIPLTALEDGPSTSDKLDSRSRLGGDFPSSAGKADEAWEPVGQFLNQTGTPNCAQIDGQRPLSVFSQSSAYIVYPVTTKGVDSKLVQVKDAEHDQSQPFIFISPSSPTTPPLPSAPPKSNRRLSISTVWSQESMWSREKMPDVPVPPMPPLAHLPVTQRVAFSPLMVAGFQNRRSTSSLPRSVGQSDFEEDF